MIERAVISAGDAGFQSGCCAQNAKLYSGGIRLDNDLLGTAPLAPKPTNERRTTMPARDSCTTVLDGYRPTLAPMFPVGITEWPYDEIARAFTYHSGPGLSWGLGGSAILCSGFAHDLFVGC